MNTSEMTASLKSNDNSGSYTEDIVINKKSSRCNQSYILKWLPLFLSIIAIIISIILIFIVLDVKSNSNDAMNLAESSETAIAHLSRNQILAQFAFEQRIRSAADSGITVTRQYYDGDAMYDDATYSNGAISAIHDHANFINVAGMGEISAVLNGVEFQTRHNDYNLEMPSRSSTEYGETEPIPMPDVPPQILNAENVTEQIVEMQEWFRAFKTQNKSHRYYPDYFKPILCYLEGTWIMDEGILEEPFDSDRHEIDASTWKELHDKIRYMVNSGRKDPLENLAHLPSSIRNLINDIYPVISNWEYRITCHPLSNDIPTARFRVADDLSVQLFMSPLTRAELYYSRRARFEISKHINISDPDGDEAYPNGYWLPGIKTWNYLDYLMEQIPGKDNYAANLTDELPGGVDVFGNPRERDRAIHFNDGSPLNSGYYTRYFQLTGADAMGSTRHRRSYNDRYLFAAKTTQERVSPISMDYDGEYVESRWSYAIPLEIIYTTPLINWNPYNVKYVYVPLTEANFTRTGTCGDDPFTEWNDFRAYYTPSEFYSKMGDSTMADTAQSDRCVLGSDGEEHRVFASGHWITFPSIGNDVGFVRQRYPIPPIHVGGSPSFKEVKSLQDIILSDDYDDPINGVDFFGDKRDRIYGFDLNVWGGSHEHIMHIAGWKVTMFWYDDVNDVYYNGSDYKIIADTDIANGHEHTIIAWRWRETENSKWKYVIEQCKFGTQNDGGTWTNNTCADGHNALIRGYDE